MKMPSNRIIWVQIFLIFVLPVMLICLNVFTYGSRLVLLAMGSLAVYGIIKHEKWSYEELGLRHDNFKKAIPVYLFFTIMGVMLLFFLDHRFEFPEINNFNFIIKTFILFIPISFFQEFAFRSFLLPRLKKVCSNNFYIILTNAALFTFMHVIYPNLNVVLPLIFISGVFFAWLYLKYPNLVLISVSHSILNLVAMLLGFFGTR